MEILHAHVPPPPVPRGKFRGAPSSTAEEELSQPSLKGSTLTAFHRCRMRSRRSCKPDRCSKRRKKSSQDRTESDSQGCDVSMERSHEPSGNGGGIKQVIGTHIEVQSGHLLGERLLDTAIKNGCDVPPWLQYYR